MLEMDMLGFDSTPSLFILTGAIDGLDLEARRLLIGTHVLEVLPFVPLAPIRVGHHVLVNGVRDPHTGREIAVEVSPVQLTRRGPGRDVSGRSRRVRMLGLIVSLLLELHDEVQVLDCELLPTGGYAVRLSIPGEVGKIAFVPSAVLEGALHDRTSRRTVRNLLHAAVEILRGQRAIGDSRATLAELPRTDNAWTHARCARCHGVLRPIDIVVVVDGVQSHVTCPQTGSTDPAV